MGPNSHVDTMHTGQRMLCLTADHTINETSRSDLEEAGSSCRSQFPLRLSRYGRQPTDFAKGIFFHKAGERRGLETLNMRKCVF